MAMTLITTNTHTSDSDATSDFTSGIDSTYKLYIFKFININPATDGAALTFQGNASDATGYNETMTTTFFRSYHREDDAEYGVGYVADSDQAQGTAFQYLTAAAQMGNEADASVAGTLWLFNPSNTTYVKHFCCTTQSGNTTGNAASQHAFIAGYFNTTTAIDDIQFKMASGNMDGVIKMYGVG